MKHFTCLSVSAVSLLLLVGGCATRDEDQDPAPKTASISDLTYTSRYTNIPEPMVEVTAMFIGYNSAGQAGNELFGLGQTRIAGGYRIYKHRQTFVSGGGPNDGTAWGPHDLGPWQVLSGPNGGGALKLAVKGFTLYAVTDDNKLWVSSTSGWTDTGIRAVDVASNGYFVFYLGEANIHNGHPVFLLNSTNTAGTETSPGAAGVELAVDGFDRPWVVGANRGIYVGPSAHHGGYSAPYEQVPGEAVDIASNGPTVAVLGSGTGYKTFGYTIYKRNTSDPVTLNSWTDEGGEALRIDSNAKSDYFVVNDRGDVFKGRN